MNVDGGVRSGKIADHFEYFARTLCMRDSAVVAIIINRGVQSLGGGIKSAVDFTDSIIQIKRPLSSSSNSVMPHSFPHKFPTHFISVDRG